MTGAVTHLTLDISTLKVERQAVWESQRQERRTEVRLLTDLQRSSWRE